MSRLRSRIWVAGLLLMASLVPSPSGSAQESAGEAAPETPPQGPLDLFVGMTRAQLEAQGFTRREAEAGGGPVVWWEKGSGDPLVLVHGVNDQAGTWFRVADALSADARVLLVDLPGHGESAPASGPLTMTRVIEGFEAWLDHAVAESAAPAPVLVGNSMGAWVSLLAAHRNPGRVTRVVAVNGGPLTADPGELTLQPETREEARAVMAALRDPSSPPTPDFVLDDLVRRAKHNQLQRMLEASEDLERYLYDDRLGEIRVPVDLLWGASDRYLGRDYPERLAAGLPRARLTWIETCGHLPQAECPERFLEQLREVLALPVPAAGPKAEAEGPKEPEEGDHAG